jgi:hypothetical protein
MKNLKLKIYFLIIIFFSVLSSCEDASDCNYEANRKVKLAFSTYNEVKKLYSDTTVSSLDINCSNDTILYSNASASSVGLPLSQLSDTSIFYFVFDSIATDKDTVTFISSRKLEMISSNCGFNTRFAIDSVIYSKNNISEIQIVEKNIDKDLDMGRNCRLVLKKKKKS